MASIIGRIESPTRGQRVGSGANLLVSGWAADTTAQGWSGIDGVEVWSGAKDKGGTKLASGMVGLNRPDVADALGCCATSGFNAVVPASALSSLSGASSLFVYLHTPNKGTWYKTASINVSAGVSNLQAPIVGFLRPVGGEIISQKQKNNKYSLYGFALDPTPITDPNTQTLGPAQSGISSVTIYLDGKRGDPNAMNLGTAGLAAGILVNNATTVGPGAPTDFGKFSYVTRGYGNQFDLAAWSLPTNPSLFAAEQEHTAYAYARSSITGLESMAQVTFFVKGGNKVLAP